jgi:WD40 repeat protein
MHRIFRVGGSPKAIAFSPDGRYIISGVGGSVWDIETGDLVSKPVDICAPYVLSLDGKFLAFQEAGGMILILGVRTKHFWAARGTHKYDSLHRIRTRQQACCVWLA